MSYIPKNIKDKTNGKKYKTDSVGMSDSQVLIFEDIVLKIQEKSSETENEAEMMKWLYGRLPVPELIAHENDKNTSFILMSKVKGSMLCESAFANDPKKLISFLAEGLKMMWSIGTEGCPCDNTLPLRLDAAKSNAENGLVDTENAEPETFGDGGFGSPEELLEWLRDNKPNEEPVLTHGDYSLENIFVNDGKISGFIDLGKAGIADKWQDIAICYRSLTHTFAEEYAKELFNPDMLFETLGIEKDEAKLKYYILLDELF